MKNKDKEINEFILCLIFGYPIFYILAPLASNGNIPEDYKQKYYWLEILIIYLITMVFVGYSIFRDDRKKVNLINENNAVLCGIFFAVDVALMITFYFVISNIILKIILISLMGILFILCIFYINSKRLLFYKDKIILYNFKRKKYPKDAHIKVIINDNNVVININEDSYTFKLSKEQLSNFKNKITNAYSITKEYK